MPNIVKNTTLPSLLDILAPHSCRGCGRIGNVLCNRCKNNIILENSKDTIPYKFKNNQFAFTLDCETSCKIAIHLEDNAKNKSPKKGV